MWFIENLRLLRSMSMEELLDELGQTRARQVLEQDLRRKRVEEAMADLGRGSRNQAAKATGYHPSVISAVVSGLHNRPDVLSAIEEWLFGNSYD